MTQTNKIGVMADISYLSVFRPVAPLEGKGREGKGREDEIVYRGPTREGEKGRGEKGPVNSGTASDRSIERCDAMRCIGEETPIDRVCPTLLIPNSSVVLAPLFFPRVRVRVRASSGLSLRYSS